MIDSSFLQYLGLVEKEARVYTAMLSLGNATILQISREAGINRTTIYPIIESLRSKGLLKISYEGLKRRFVANDPQVLKQVWEKRTFEAEKNIQQLQSLYGKGQQQTSIEIYEGLTALKAVYESLIRDIQTGEDYCIISNPEEWLEADEKYFLDFTKRRAKRDINIRLLLEDTSVSKFYLESQKQLNQKVKILPKSISFDTNMVITPQKMLIHQLTPPVSGIVIYNQSTIKMQMQIFDVLWNTL